MADKAKIIVSKKDVMGALDGQEGAVKLTSREVIGERVLRAVILICAAITGLLLASWVWATYLHPGDADAVTERTLKVFKGFTEPWFLAIAAVIAVLLGQRISKDGAAISE